MNKIYKNLIIFFIILIVFVNLFTTTAYADTGGFKVPYVHYVVTLNEDGSARVVENWELEYFSSGNTFNERYVLKKTNKIAERTTMKDLNVYIDEVPCTEVKEEEYKEDYTYHVSENDKSYKISTFLNSKDNDIRQITIAYILKDLVKSVEGKYYYVNFDAFPVAMEQRIKDFDMYFRLWNDEPLELIENPNIYPHFTSYSLEKGDLMTHIGSLSESKHYISFKMPNKYFNIDKNSLISEKDIKDDINPILGCSLILIAYFVLYITIIKIKRRSLKIHMKPKKVIYSVLLLFILSVASAPYYILAIIFLGYLIYGLFYGFSQEDLAKKIEENTEKLKRDPQLATEIIYKYKNQVDYRNLLDTLTPNAHLSLFVRLADAHQKKLLTITDNGDIIFKLTDNKDPLFKILKDIKKYCDKKDIQYINNNGEIILPLNAIKKYFKEIANYKFVFNVFHPTINNVLDEYNKNEKDRKLRKEFKNDCLLLINISEIPNEKNISFTEILQQPITPQLHMTFLRNNLENKPNSQDHHAIDYALYEMYKDHVKLCKEKKCDPDTGLPTK